VWSESRTRGVVMTMPSSAPCPCRKPGCAELVSKAGFCERHRKEKHRANKQVVSQDYRERNRFYQRALWKRIRAVQLQLEPLCRACRKQGRLVAAEVVDHIIPFNDDKDPLSVDKTNLQSLCKSCHNAKTLKETQGRVKSA
jgi:5-methylcytosine-specific restriction protein A